MSIRCRRLIADLKRQLTGPGFHLAGAQRAIVALLEYLCTPEGRSDENCRAVDAAICEMLQVDEVDLKWLPADWCALLWDMGGQLHDAVSAPDVARGFESSPEQLLARARAAMRP